MTLLENERRPQHAGRKQHKRRRLRQQHQQQRQLALALDAPLSALHDDQVLTFLEWCRLNRISERNGRRIIASGHGPAVVQLSPRRLGVTVGANHRWQAAKTRG